VKDATHGPRIVLIGGGARSGKSAFALELARGSGPRRAFVATAQAFDDEMRVRIAAHARSRGDDFKTIEEPLALAATLAELRDIDVVVVDCLTLWLSNLLLRDEGEARILEQVDALARVLERRPCQVILVTNEVGMGLVPETPLGRAFRDLAGHTHQRLAGIADEIYLAVLGVVVRLRPEPVSIRSPMRG
jgi:adenosylcobinamide kinase/adenosylcobinamide-phosphate guanylyltransferase